MSYKAFAVTCERYYPGIVSYYAAETKDGAITVALFDMYKVGGRARRNDLTAMHSPEYDFLAARQSRSVCLDPLLKQEKSIPLQPS